MKRNLIFCLSVTFLLTALSGAKTLNVPSIKYNTIQAAIDAANDGDTIIIASGRYVGTGFWVNHDLTITGAFPNDPNRTVIDCNGRWDGGFGLVGNGGTCELKGLTIANIYTHAWDAIDGEDPGDPGFHGGDNIGFVPWDIAGAILISGNHKVTNCIIRNISLEGGDGGDGVDGDSNSLTKNGGKGGDGGIAGGAGILIESGSPVIKNCLIEDCAVIGGDGGNGGDGNNDEANSVNSGSGGQGGIAGGVYGAGICVYDIYGLGNLSPTFENCIIRNCRAKGGNGGDGGDSGRGAGPGAYGGLTYYDLTQDAPINHSAMGGGVYIDAGCSATFINCTVSSSSTDGSISGIGGVGWEGGRQHPQQETHIASFGGGIYGGYVGSITFSNCDIQDNNTAYYNDEYTGYGGGLAIAEATSVKFTNCDITGNSAPAGGGFYGGWIGTLQVSGNNFLDNSSYLGGGLFINDINSADIFNTVISGNSAIFTSDGFYGSGGGIYCATSGTRIFDCSITENTASSSGGGVYIDADINTLLFDCLIAGNTINRNGGGGGVSANWWADLNIKNCTIANNTITSGGFGGGVSCTYEASIGIINSIIWNNNSQYGQSLAIGSPYSAAGDDNADIIVNYSDLQDARAGVFVASGSQLYWNTMGDPNDPNTDTNLSGTSLASPLFVNGYWGNFYLSQPTGQTTTSPCVDAGFGLAIDNNLFRHTTRTDHVIDDGNTDMGYHYLRNSDLPGDLNYDGQVDTFDLGLFARNWLSTGCTFPYFCQGGDLTEDGKVNFEDFALFAEYWNEEETTPPTPNPMTWKILPRSAGLNSVTMRATTAKDYSGSLVQYFFHRVDSNGITADFGWFDDPNFTDTGLVTKRLYGYEVMARDARDNKTGWSVKAYAVPGEDWTAPEPNPMTWAIMPYPTSPNSVAMTATTASDPCGVEYYFSELSGNPGGSNSGWQDSPFYEDFGLDPNTTYIYQVKARDKSLNHNETAPSISVSVNTSGGGPLPPDITPPEPDYAQAIYELWVVTPQSESYDGGYTYRHRMVAVPATDAESPPVSYWFECKGSGTSSGWLFPANTSLPIEYIGPEYSVENHASYRVHIRNDVGLELTSSWWHTLDGPVP